LNISYKSRYIGSSIMYLKIHHGEFSHVVAIADRTLIGRTLKEGMLQIEVSEYFYKGEIVTEADVVSVLKNTNNANMIGTKVVNCAIEHGFVKADNIIMIDGVPHAQIILI